MVCAPARASESDPWFAQDKYLHGGVSAGLTLGGYAAASLFLEEPKWRLMSGAGLALAAGITKEVVDLCGPGDASWRDMTWDVMGVATGALVAWLVDTYVFR